MPMRFVDLDGRTKFLLLIAFMVTCIVSLSAIPLLMPWGADMQNVHAFQQCVHGQSPYLVDAKACGDMLVAAVLLPAVPVRLFPLGASADARDDDAHLDLFLSASFVGIFCAWAKHITRSAPPARATSS